MDRAGRRHAHVPGPLVPPAVPQSVGQRLGDEFARPLAGDIEIGHAAPQVAAHPDPALFQAPVFERLDHDFHRLGGGRLRRRLFHREVEITDLAFSRASDDERDTDKRTSGW
jgi:hypothetical protein